MANQINFSWPLFLNGTLDTLQENHDEYLSNLSYVETKRIWRNMEPIRDPLFIVIPITIIYVLIFITGMVGNVSTCVVILRNKSMHTATNYYLFSLAISDLLLLMSGLPQEMYSIWYRYPYIFGEVFCVLRGLAAETSTNATVLTITAFTIERYIAICHPFLSHTMSKLSRAVKLIFVIWFMALAFAIPQALQFGVVMHGESTVCTQKIVIIEHSFEISTFLFFVTPMTLITLLYALIGLRLRSSDMMKKERPRKFSESSRTGKTGSSVKRSDSKKVTSQSSRRVLKMLVAVVVAFFICWAPFHVQRLVAIYGTVGSHTAISPLVRTIYIITTYISGILYYLSTTINPVLYHIMSVKFREAFKETFEAAGIQCQEQQGNGHQREVKHQKMLAKYSYSRDAPLRVTGQDGTSYLDESSREKTAGRTKFRKQHGIPCGANRVVCRRNSSGGTEQFSSTSSSYVRSTSLSLPTSHDTVLVAQQPPHTCCCSRCDNDHSVIHKEEIFSNTHIHYSNNYTNTDVCHFGMMTQGCCLDSITIKEKKSKIKSLWDTIKCASDGNDFLNPSFTSIVQHPKVTTENETQTYSDDIINHPFFFNDTIMNHEGKDELSSYMEEIRRREQSENING